MPYVRKTLTQLRLEVALDQAAKFPGANALLDYANLKITGEAQAGLAFLHYGYIDWLAKQAVPFTAEDEFLQGWAAIKDVFLNDPTQASGTVTFPGVDTTPLPINTPLVRADGATFHTTSAGVIAGTTVTVSAIADADPQGQFGAFGNMSAGVVLTLGTAIPGIQSDGLTATPFTGGSDVETNDSLRNRMLIAFQSAPEIGNDGNYRKWALSVPGVTRAWVTPNGMGAGTVVVRFMMDMVNTGSNGFPVGTDGVATGETRDTPATGDQLDVANYIFPRRPVTALVYAVAPTPEAVNFIIDGISTATPETKASINAAVDEVFKRLGVPGGTVPLSDIEAAIASVPTAEGFILTAPPGNVTTGAGAIPVRGSMTYT